MNIYPKCISIKSSMSRKVKSAEFKHDTISYYTQGEGQSIVLIHGFLESAEMWFEYANELAKTHYVIMPNLPGHGNTACFGYDHSMELMGDSVIAILKAENKRKAIVVGHSMGGYVAMAMADKHPDVLKGLCLYHSTAKSDSAERKNGRLQAIKLVQQNHKSFIRISIPLLFRPKYRIPYRQEINKLKRAALLMPKQGIIAALQGMRERPNREIIFKFPPYPVLLIGGKHDHLIPFNDLKIQASLSENVQAIRLKEAGHMSFVEEKENALNWIVRWLKHRET